MDDGVRRREIRWCRSMRILENNMEMMKERSNHRGGRKVLIFMTFTMEACHPWLGRREAKRPVAPERQLGNETELPWSVTQTSKGRYPFGGGMVPEGVDLVPPMTRT
jgi:hypothetical protein